MDRRNMAELEARINDFIKYILFMYNECKPQRNRPHSNIGRTQYLILKEIIRKIPYPTYPNYKKNEKLRNIINIDFTTEQELILENGRFRDALVEILNETEKEYAQPATPYDKGYNDALYRVRVAAFAVLPEKYLENSKEV